MPRGGILGYASQLEKPTSFAVSIEQLSLWIRQSNAGQVYLFADVCRSPGESSKKNRINYWFEEALGKLDRNLEAFLASQPARRSFEKEGLGGREGHGIFAYFLERGLQQGQADADRNKIVTVPELYAYLREEVRRATNRKQEPLHFGNLDRPAALADLRKAPSREPIAASLGKHLILLASAGGLSPGALAAPASPRPSPAPQADPRHTRFRTALEDEKLLGSDGAVELFRGLRTALPPETAHTEQINLAAALESQGQQIFLRYGIGDQFPDDPLRPRKSDFDEAAELFRLAQELRPEDLSAELEIEVRDSLEARKLFCRGRSLIFDPGRSGEAVSLLQRAVRASDRFAEPYNALGIARLEQADYTNAINAFQDALAQAPDWAYARHNLALTYIESGDYQAAEREYREAILRAPYHPYLYYNLGLLLQRLNRNRDAEREYRRSLETFDEQAAKYHSRALRWARADKEEESRLAFLRERILRKNQAEVHNALGSLWQGRGKNDRAERHYLVAVKRNPDLLPARYNLLSPA